MMPPIRIIRVRPRRVARPAPPISDGAHAERTERSALPAEIDALCCEWAAWAETRKFYGPSDRLADTLGKLRTRTARATDGSAGPNARVSAALAAFNAAVQAGGDGLDRTVFELHYLYRPKPIKRAAAALEISSKHWYALRNRFARSAYARHFGYLPADCR
jgi:hypothetical protein